MIRTSQDVFNIVVCHLRKQGRKALSADGERCMYHAPDGTKCAVGVLVPDCEYDPIWDRDEKLGAINVNYKSCPGITQYLSLKGYDLMLLRMLQVVHDECSPHVWEKQWRYIAEQYRLTMPPKEK